MVLHVEKTLKTTIQKKLPKSRKFERKISVAGFSYCQTIFLRFTVIVFHISLDEKITSNEQKVTSNNQKITDNEQKATRNEQKVTSKEQKVTCNEQRAKSLASNVVAMIILRSTYKSKVKVKCGYTINFDDLFRVK